jgi:hypothetical protein
MVSALRPFFLPKLYHLTGVHIRKSDDLNNQLRQSWWNAAAVALLAFRHRTMLDHAVPWQ